MHARKIIMSRHAQRFSPPISDLGHGAMIGGGKESASEELVTVACIAAFRDECPLYQAPKDRRNRNSNQYNKRD